MKTVMQHSFAKVARADIPRAQFDRSHGIKTTFDAGYLVPIFVDEIVPGDSVNLRATLFARLATPLKPIMDNARLETFWFFVPNRLLWSNWQKFCGEQTDPGDSIDYTVPQLTSYTFAVGSLGDYFGIPVGTAVQVNALHFRAYNKIYNDWFRDQNLQDSLTLNTGDGPDGSVGTTYALRRRGKRHDYFTSALPWPQKGATAVSLPLGTEAPVTGIGVLGASAAGTAFRESDGTLQSYANIFDANVAANRVVVEEDPTNATYPNVNVDLANATAATINQLRQAFAIQKLLERDARGGTRYIEVIKSHFGVTSSDGRLQRAEYLGGGSSPLGIQPVANTSDTASADQGDLAGIGTVFGDKGHGFVKAFEEWGVLIGLVNVRADLTYQQGLDRMWSRQTRYDYLWPVFSHIGEQAILNKEIFVDGVNDDNVFGYTGRYDEMRHKQSRITGLFRSDVGASLDAWHLSQDFASTPTLGDTFIQDDPPFDRVIAVPSEPHFILDGYIKMLHTRPLPVYGTPGLIDHF